MTTAPQGDQAPPLTRADAAAAVDLGLTAGELDILRSGRLPIDMEQRIARVLPGDALADGWRVETDTDQSETRDDDAVLDLESVLEEAAGMARLGVGASGGAYLYLVQRGTVDDAEPMEPVEGGHDIAAVHALELSEVRPVEWDRDPQSERWGTPSHYSIEAQRGSVVTSVARVHASRLVYVGSGLPTRAGARKSSGSRDYSIGHVYCKAVRDVEQGWDSASILLRRRSIPQVGIANMKTMKARDLAAFMRQFLAKLHQRSLAVLDAADTFSFTAPSVSGTAELLTALAWRLCMVEGYSLTKLFGQPPAGMTSDDQAAAKGHAQMVGRYRKNVLKPVLLRLYTVMMGPDPSRRIVWPPTDEPTQKEQAETSLLHAQRDVAYVQAGVWTEDEVRSRFGEDEVPLPLLDDAAWEADLDEPVMPPFGFAAEEPAADGATSPG